LQGWDFPDTFATLQRRLVARQGKAGKREYVQILRQLERLALEVLHCAIRDARQIGATSFDAVNIWFCGGLNGARPGWIWISARSCPLRYAHIPRQAVGETGFVPLGKTNAELLFEEWNKTQVANAGLAHCWTGALLDCRLNLGKSRLVET
jgi:hypothetical protein